MNTSPAIGQLAKALAAAQLEFQSVKKDSDNSYYESKYADLSAIIAATQPSLAKNGLVVIQSPVVQLENQKAGVVTTLAHESGEWMSDECILPATMEKKDKTIRFDAQSVGSAITYARRYSYQAMIGVAAEVDDDANAAVGNGTVAAAQAVATAKLREKSTGKELVTITPYKQGYLALSGAGLSIIRANLDNAKRAVFGWVQEGNVFMIPVDRKKLFVALCTDLQVSVLDDSSTAATPEPKPNGQAPAAPPFADDASTDPVIVSARKVEKPGKKPHVAINWGGVFLNIFDTTLWPVFLGNVGKTAHIQWAPSRDGKYKNFVSLDRLNGIAFAGVDELEPEYVPGESDVPF